MTLLKNPYAQAMYLPDFQPMVVVLVSGQSRVEPKRDTKLKVILECVVNNTITAIVLSNQIHTNDHARYSRRLK